MYMFKTKTLINNLLILLASMILKKITLQPTFHQFADYRVNAGIAYHVKSASHLMGLAKHQKDLRYVVQAKENNNYTIHLVNQSKKQIILENLCYEAVIINEQENKIRQQRNLQQLRKGDHTVLRGEVIGKNFFNIAEETSKGNIYIPSLWLARIYDEMIIAEEINKHKKQDEKLNEKTFLQAIGLERRLTA